MGQSAEVFISYSREDESRVFDLADRLRAAGVSLWIDQGGLDGATQWSEQIVNALESAKVLLLMVTESAVRSDNVAKEVVLVSERKGHILPVYLEPTVIPSTLKYQLAGIQHISYFKGDDPGANLQAILRSLERIGVRLTLPKESKEPMPSVDAGGRGTGTTAALELLRLAVSKGQLNFNWMKHDPDLAALRHNAEFIAITSA